MSDENSIFERQKEIIKFYQEYIEPSYSKFFEILKYTITFIILLNGTTIISLFSFGDSKYYLAMAYLLSNLFFIFVLLLIVIFFYKHALSYVTPNTVMLHKRVLEYKYNLCVLYTALFAFILLEFFFFAQGIYEAKLVFIAS